MLALLQKCEKLGVKDLPNLKNELEFNQEKVLSYSFKIL